jgi:hypothetical protein
MQILIAAEQTTTGFILCAKVLNKARREDAPSFIRQSFLTYTSSTERRAMKLNFITHEWKVSEHLSSSRSTESNRS